MNALGTTCEFDRFLSNLHSLCKDRLDPYITAVKRAKAEWELLERLPLARDFMLNSLQLGDRSVWRDCVRVARLRVICEAVAQSMDTQALVRSLDPRLISCLNACECVEQVIKDSGLSRRLQDAQAKEHDALVKKNGTDLESSESAWPGLSNVFKISMCSTAACDETDNESETSEVTDSSNDEEATNSQDSWIAHVAAASAANAEGTYLDMAGDLSGAMEQYALCSAELRLALSGEVRQVDVAKLQSQLKQVEGRMTALHPLLTSAKFPVHMKPSTRVVKPGARAAAPLLPISASAAVAAGPWLATR
eukprot:TRINITY_DN14982_c0_g1_i1.p1 TRINITY_DN14982_c0_g1~~TRINITY_DN14982_c0_g1_i1.p1  ORF type:complete len:307 (+),score=49.39 TRINITY_DN14982_c0_g1_i1:108-1028(+)